MAFINHESLFILYKYVTIFIISTKILAENYFIFLEQIKAVT